MQPHFACAWAWAGNTPFQWGKQVASHLDGTRNPMVVSWPKRIRDRGGLRSQFTHVIDVAPTVLEVAGITAPKQVDGIDQMPMHGTSLSIRSTSPRSHHRVEGPDVWRPDRHVRVQGKALELIV